MAVNCGSQRSVNCPKSNSGAFSDPPAMKSIPIHLPICILGMSMRVILVESQYNTLEKWTGDVWPSQFGVHDIKRWLKWLQLFLLSAVQLAAVDRREDNVSFWNCLPYCYEMETSERQSFVACIWKICADKIINRCNFSVWRVSLCHGEGSE